MCSVYKIFVQKQANQLFHTLPDFPILYNTISFKHNEFDLFYFFVLHTNSTSAIHWPFAISIQVLNANLHDGVSNYTTCV